MNLTTISIAATTSNSVPLTSALNALSFTPILAASIAGILAFAGWHFTLRELLTHDRIPRDRNKFNRTDVKPPLHKKHLFETRQKERSDLPKQLLNMFLVCISVYVIAKMLTSSDEISAALAIIATSFPALMAKKRAAQFQREQERAWPEAIDSIISSLHAGQSINESIASLKKYGPLRLRSIFEGISDRLEEGATLAEAIQGQSVQGQSVQGQSVQGQSVRDRSLGSDAVPINSPSATQLFVTLIHAKEFGGQEVTSTLRLLANFLRDQAAAVEEIETRFGWVKNSALLGAFAPWLLLALLSMQQSTVAAFATEAGRVVLTIGIVATALAFIWMEKLAKLPTQTSPLALKTS